MKLNLGCYERPREGYINLDKEKYFPHVDITCDVEEEKLPWPDNYFEEVYCRCVLEHLRIDKIDFVVSEMHRVTKPGGVVRIIVPHEERAWDFMEHTREFTFGFFYTLSKSSEGYHHDMITKGREFKIKKLNNQPYGLGNYMPSFVRKKLSHFIKGLIYTIDCELIVAKKEGENDKR